MKPVSSMSSLATGKGLFNIRFQFAELSHRRMHQVW
jgi:hypothetical protein